jgi:hypothetical protein
MSSSFSSFFVIICTFYNKKEEKYRKTEFEVRRGESERRKR